MYNFQSKLVKAATYPDERFAALLLASDPLSAKLDVGQRGEVIAEALTCGKSVGREFSRRFDGKPASDIARLLGITIVEADTPGLRMVLASYQTGRKLINLNRGALSLLEEQFCIHNLTEDFGPFYAAEAAIAHELFHYVEDTDHTLFTRSFRITLWRIGPLRYRSTLPAAGEIAAMACAKSLCNLTFNPLLIESILLSATGADQANDWLARLDQIS